MNRGAAAQIAFGALIAGVGAGICVGMAVSGLPTGIVVLLVSLLAGIGTATILGART